MSKPVTVLRDLMTKSWWQRSHATMSKLECIVCWVQCRQ